MKKKILSLLLAVVMIVSILPTAFAASGYSDVPTDVWYAEPVGYATEHGLMSGVGNNRFAPNDSMTRAMAVQVLYRIAGSPAVSRTNPFTDVSADAWYATAVIWAVDNEITGGTSATTFSPDARVTREQLVTFLYKYAKTTKLELTSTDIGGYADASSVSGWAVDAFRWAVSAGAISGVGSNRIAPKNNATRAECATILAKFDKMVKANPDVPTEPEPTEPPVYYHDWHFVEEQGHNEVVQEAYDETVTEYKYESHVFCNGCGKDFGYGPDAVSQAGHHCAKDFWDDCQSYRSERVPVPYETTVHHDAVTQWVIDVPAHWECSVCGKTVNGTAKPSDEGCKP